ncbi:unnamed protein product [Prorocentrum cordatum]|uniref:Uncharacterized protein n=1 Tax=Prorocentrum cordatum TaxID=2364126 RepID=A0ABN9VAT7_9DINO|nr:unnamed protein product [Polarella glacialis]
MQRWFPFPGKGIGDYLQLAGLSASCGDGGDAGLFRADTLEEARAACDARPSCDFFSWSRGDRAAILCSGGAARFKEHPSSAVGVHPRLLGLGGRGYASLPNYQAVCEPGQVLAEVPGVHSASEAARMCDEHQGCTYFALSTVKDKWSRLEPRGTPFYPANTLWLCGGEPVFRRRMGWLSAGQLRHMPPLPPAPDSPPDVAAPGVDPVPVQRRYPRSPAARPPRSPGDFIFSEPVRPKFEELYEPMPSAARQRKDATRELLGNVSKVTL